MKWRPKNIRESIYPVLVLNWLIGLGLIDYPVGNLRHKLFIIAILLIASFFWVALFYYENVPCLLKQNHNLTTTLFSAMRYMYTFTASSSIMIGWYYRKKMYLFTQNFERMDEAFECLGRKKNYYKSFRNILCRVLVLIILMVSVFIQSVYLQIHLVNALNFMESIICISILYWPIFTCTLLDVTFEIFLHFIETRFRNINHLLRKRFCEYPKPYFYDKHKIYATTMDFQFVTHLNCKNPEKSKNMIELLKQVHLALCKLAQEINHIFGVHLTLHMTLNFIVMTMSLFNLLKTSLGPPTKFKYKIIVNSMVWFLTSLLRLLRINIACALTSNQANKTAESLLDMKALSINKKIIREIDQFHQQITLRPLTFTTCGFSTLGVNFIFRFLGTVVTYLLILIQIEHEGKGNAA